MNPLLQRAKDEVAKKIVGHEMFGGREVRPQNWEDFIKADFSQEVVLEAFEKAAELYSKYRVEEETEKMRKALEAIKNPIKHLQDLAEIEGNKINGSTAIALANSPDFYRNIAEKALNP